MSSFLRPTENKKTKNYTYHNSINIPKLNNAYKNSKLSFSNAFKNNIIKNRHSNVNSTKKKSSKNNNIYNNIDKNIPNAKKQSIKKIELKNNENNSNEEDIKENLNNNSKDFTLKYDDEDEFLSKKILNNVESYQSLGFLLPKKSNIIEETVKKKVNNGIYLKLEGYDYDGNIFDSSGKKNKEKEKTNKSDDESEIENNIQKKEEEFYYEEEDLAKIKKQEDLILELMKYKNFQNFVKKFVKNRRYKIDKKGKSLKWSSFKRHLYKIAFLDLYYKNRIPFIIMRPRLEVIKRKREERQRKIMEEEFKNKNNITKGNLKNNIEIKEGETIYASILDKNIQNEMEKKGFIIGEDNNTVRIEKRESLFPCKDGKSKGIFTLTKIPQKSDENLGNVRLKMAFNKAKDAARVVRRLEYSYSMRVNILLSKPIFQKNAKIIQNWYRSMKFIKINTPKIVKIQAFIRGMMIRKAFREVKKLYGHTLPFIKKIDKIISRRFIKFFFDKIIPTFGISTLIKLTKIKNNKIINALSRFKQKQKYLRDNYSLSTKINKKCCYTKESYEWSTRLKLEKLQTYIKSYLMHNNEKIMINFANKYNPKLYYYLKYGKNTDLLKKKLKKLREYFLKFKELKIAIKYRDKKLNNINNKYDYLKYILRKSIFNKLKNYYMDSINNKDKNYQKRMKLKILLNHQCVYNNKRILKRYLNKWNIMVNYLPKYRKILKNDKLLLIDAIIRYHKKFKEKIFLFLLNSIRENKKEKEKQSLNKILYFYNKYNKNYEKEYISNILLRALKIWRKKSKLISLSKAINMISKNAKLFIKNKKFKKKQKLFKCLIIRNQIFKEKLKIWKFNAGKLKLHYNSFIKKSLGIIGRKKRIESLKKNFSSLEKRKKNTLKKYFERFQTNTGVKKLLYINLQLCLYDENKKPIINDKYSIMKYIKDQNNINKDKLKNEMTLKGIFSFLKMKKRLNEFKKKCGQRIKAKCEYDKNLVKIKFIHWNKIYKIKKFEYACRLIQKNYRNYKRKKLKN